MIHRLRRFGRLTDLWHQGRYLDEFARRDGQWKIRHRITVHDAERWIDTADLQRLVSDSHPRKVFRGRRGEADTVYRLARLDTLARAPFRLERRQPLRQALWLPTALVFWLGDLVQWCESASRGGRP